VKTILLGVSAILILLSMVVMVWMSAFPTSPEIREQLKFAREQAEKRAEAVREWQKEEMKQFK